MINIVLLEPEIPGNTGNIGRTCLLTNTRLHLISPFPFSLSDKVLRRTGLDYWKSVDLVVHNSYEDFVNYLDHRRIFYATTKASHRYDEIKYRDGDFIMFGKESKGIPDEIIMDHPNQCIKIPMNSTMKRSLNLANSCNIILYEALRQNNFFDLC